MVKIYLGVIAVFVSTVLGQRFSLKYKNRAVYFERFKEFNLKIKQNLFYKRDNLIKLLDEDTKNKFLNCTLQSFKLILFQNEKTETVYLPNFLEDEDKSLIINYLDGLGKNNCKSELEFSNFIDEELNEKLVKIRDKSNKFSNLGQKLGFSFGLIIFILII